MATAKGVGVEIFIGFSIPAISNLTQVQADIMGETHEVSTHILAFLVILHTLVALKHHFFDKDITLTRMLKP